MEKKQVFFVVVGWAAAGKAVAIKAAQDVVQLQNAMCANFDGAGEPKKSDAKHVDASGEPQHATHTRRAVTGGSEW